MFSNRISTRHWTQACLFIQLSAMKKKNHFSHSQCDDSVTLIGQCEGKICVFCLKANVQNAKQQQLSVTETHEYEFNLIM